MNIKSLLELFTCTSLRYSIYENVYFLKDKHLTNIKYNLVMNTEYVQHTKLILNKHLYDNKCRI